MTIKELFNNLSEKRNLLLYAYRTGRSMNFDFQLYSSGVSNWGTFKLCLATECTYSRTIFDICVSG